MSTWVSIWIFLGFSNQLTACKGYGIFPFSSEHVIQNCASQFIQG